MKGQIAGYSVYEYNTCTEQCSQPNKM